MILKGKIGRKRSKKQSKISRFSRKKARCKMRLIKITIKVNSSTTAIIKYVSHHQGSLRAITMVNTEQVHKEEINKPLDIGETMIKTGKVIMFKHKR